MNMFNGASSFHFQVARFNRQSPTPAESIVWEHLKNKPLKLKFRRQHPYSNYVLDFYCHFLKLVIEIDGPIHDQHEIKLKDQERQAYLEKEGMLVKRFTNEEVLTDTVQFCNKLDAFLLDLLSQRTEAKF